MRPITIGIGGGHSGAGKTTFACRLLGMLKGWGAVKCTPGPLYTSISDDPEVINREGPDTALMLGAACPEVLWVQSTDEDMEDTMGMAVERLSHLEGVIMEGNSAIEVLKPDIVIFILGEPDRFKINAEKILHMADIVIFDEKPHPGTPSGARSFGRDRVRECLDHIVDSIDERRDNGQA
jgi:hypothetical protein